MTDLRVDTAAAMERPSDDGGIIWYELMSPDPAASKAFYDAVIGWNITSGPPEYGTYKVIGRSDGGFAGGVLSLTEDMQSHGARPMWLCYVHAADVDSKAASIAAAGGKIQMPPNDIPSVGRIAMVSDPQGAPFYIMKPLPPQGDPNARSDVFDPKAEQRVGWNELQTSDVEAARTFYGEQFGWETNDFMDMGEMGQYRFIDHGGQRLGAMFNATNGQQSHFRFYFRVPSIETAKATLEANGGVVHMGPHQVPGGDWIVIGADPQGAEFALVGDK